MSKISGHFEITNAALNLLKVACADNPVVTGVPSTPVGERFDWSDVGHFIGGTSVLLYGMDTPSPAYGAVLRDLRDIYNAGHWREHAQRHHFMRRNQQQTSFEAYENGVDWILAEAQRALDVLRGNIEKLAPKGSVTPPPATTCRVPMIVEPVAEPQNVFRGLASDHLGNAVHALQDSFSASHAKRIGLSSDDPGEISKIYVYEGAEKEGHGHSDEGWGTDDDFSDSGNQAIAATRALIELVLQSAVHQRSELRGRHSFTTRWLRVSPKIHKQREDVTDRFIEKHTYIARSDLLGASRALNGKDAGEALFREHGTDTKQVYEIVKEIREEYDAVVDDVAEAYVNQVKAGSGAAQQALKAHKPLVQLLVRVLEKGWTTGGENACIEYLKTL